MSVGSATNVIPFMNYYKLPTWILETLSDLGDKFARNILMKRLEKDFFGASLPKADGK